MKFNLFLFSSSRSTPTRLPSRSIGDQSGAALIVGLIFLVILTLLGITAMQTGILEERMAGNSRDRNLAFQAAEAALRDAEHDIHCTQSDGLTTESTKRSIGCILGMSGADSSCTEGLCCNPTAAGLSCQEPATPVYSQFSVASSPAIPYGHYTGASQLLLVSQQPAYLIEPFTVTNGNHFYRITSQGYGANSKTIVTLQEVYKY